jgi:hypothetical protein
VLLLEAHLAVWQHRLLTHPQLAPLLGPLSLCWQDLLLLLLLLLQALHGLQQALCHLKHSLQLLRLPLLLMLATWIEGCQGWAPATP